MQLLINWFENFKFKRAVKKTLSYAILCRRQFSTIDYPENVRIKQPANSFSLSAEFNPILPKDKTPVAYYLFKNIQTGEIELYGSVDNRGRFKKGLIISGSEAFNQAILENMYKAHQNLSNNPLTIAAQRSIRI